MLYAVNKLYKEGLRLPAMLYLLSNRRLSPVNPLAAGWESCAPSHAYGPHTRRYFLIHYVASGGGEFQSRGAAHRLTAGQCFVIRPGEMTYYRADAKKPWRYIWIGFTTSLPLPRILADADAFDARAYADLFGDLAEKQAYFASHAGDGGVREAYVCGKAVELLLRLGAAESADAHDLPPTVAVAKNMLDTEFASSLTVAALAERLHHDRAYFSRLFRASLGMSPQQYLVKRRMTEAARLLTECGFSPTTAAAAVGYPDLFSFSKMFKKRYGMPPSVYAARSAAGEKKEP